jgi:hypothetical protein
MNASLKGYLQGKTITLDDPVPPLEGRRVRVVIEPVDESTIELGPREQAALWRDWSRSGPQGPIEDDGDPEFP